MIQSLAELPSAMRALSIGTRQKLGWRQYYGSFLLQYHKNGPCSQLTIFEPLKNKRQLHLPSWCTTDYKPNTDIPSKIIGITSEEE
jgi:hypothetical protein